MRLPRFLVGLVLTALLARAESSPVEGFSFVRSLAGISEYTLDANGLQVLLMPEHSAPVLTFMVTYRVGSRNEVTGTTGATHLLEHLMFKGTTRFQRDKGNGYDQQLDRIGAINNATTWLDRTNYYANVGSDHLALVTELEADRMRNLLLRDEDRQPEMTVVRNEFERGENSPIQALIKEIYQAAYVAHPYHHSTIGWRSDIEKVSIEKLREFYDTFYWPNNATVTVIGDFEPTEALRLIKQHYGPIPRSPHPIPEVYTEEPEQTYPRRVGVKRAGQLGVVAIGHKMPAATHADYPAISMLSAILTDGKNSRLYKTLTDPGLATSVFALPGFNLDPSLHITFAALTPGTSHEQVEKIIDDEIERLKREGVTELELQNAVAKSLAESAFQRDGSFAIAGIINECVAIGDWTLYATLDDALRRITREDVQRVAQRYFQRDHSTTGWFVPVRPDQAGAAPPAGAAPRVAPAADGPYFYRPPEGGPLSARDIAPPVRGATGGAITLARLKAERVRVAGIDLILYPTGIRDVVTLRGSLPAGDVFSPADNPAIATLVGAMLDKGTQQRDKFAIAQELESVGASLSFSVSGHTLDIAGKCLRQDVPRLLALLAEQLRTPALSAEEFEKLKPQLIGNQQRALESTDLQAAQAFSRAVFSPGHPNRDVTTEEFIDGIRRATIEDLRAFHAAHYGPAHLILVAVGDLDREGFKRELGRAFTGWSGGSALPTAPRASAEPSTREQVVFLADKPSVSVILGQASGLKYGDPDYFALRVGTSILGSGFTSRLLGTVRDREGLTYGIHAALMNDSFNDGDWRIAATFAPDLLERGIASTRRELAAWFEKGVTAGELETRKANLIGTFKVAMATTEGLARQLLASVQRGYDVSFLDEYPNIINRLTLEEVNAAIRRHLAPDKMVLIKAGSVPGAP